MLGAIQNTSCTSEAAKEQQAHTDHQQPHRAMHMAGQAQQIYKPGTLIPFTSEMHMMAVFQGAHVALISAFMERQTIQQTCTFLS